MNQTNLPDNKNFGLFFSIVFLLLSFLLFIYSYYLYSSSLLVISLIFLITSFINPNKLHMLNFLWYKLGIFLGYVVSPIVLGLIFYMIISPVALIGKLLRRDSLRLRSNVDKKTYWIRRSHDKMKTKFFKNQF